MGSHCPVMEDGGHGIKELLQAEKDAAQIVGDAKGKRQETMKRAKDDAQKEIAEYKAKREAEFKAYESKHSSGGSSSSEKLAQHPKEAIADLQKEAESNRGKVVDLLVKYVTTVN